MLKIINIKNHTINYECSCGVIGECMFKSPNENTVLIVELVCPVCESAERLKFLKYDSEQSRIDLIKDNIDLHWATVVDNKIIKDKQNNV